LQRKDLAKKDLAINLIERIEEREKGFIYLAQVVRESRDLLEIKQMRNS
jgi:hypothetical protein